MREGRQEGRKGRDGTGRVEQVMRGLQMKREHMNWMRERMKGMKMRRKEGREEGGRDRTRREWSGR